ncbi:MAG: formylglycine-generating enzyme family protein [Anaerolineae bacterium]
MSVSARNVGELIATRDPIEPEMVLIPAGEFLMGSDPKRDPRARRDEVPQHRLYLPDYALSRTPITNAQYAIFLRATRHRPPIHWRILFIKHRWPPFKRANYPVVHVTWEDANAYCQWLSEVTGKPYRLPSEAEWEKGARGPDGRIYPWGNEWEVGVCNISSDPEHPPGTTPIDAFPQSASPYGLLDMVGNIWEWTRSLWGLDLRKPTYGYPYDPDDGRENQLAGSRVRRVLRGVSFYNGPAMARCAQRYRYSPRNHFDSVGFRVALSPDAE